MATKFNVISLGDLASIDPIEGNTESEKVDAILCTYGSPGSPLHQQVEEFSPERFDGGIGTDVLTGAAGYDVFA